MIKYLLWDFDGVICDSKEIAFQVHNEIAKKYEKLPLILNEQDYSKMMNKGYDNSLNKYLSQKEINEYFFEHREAMFDRRKEFKTFSKIIQYIQLKKISSSIITATYEKLVIEVLQNNGYEKDIFDYIMGRETNGSKAEKINDLCNKLEMKKEEVLYIGDTLSDVDFCNKIGIPIVCVGYGYCQSSVLGKENILKMCKTQEELIEYIDYIIKHEV